MYELSHNYSNCVHEIKVIIGMHKDYKLFVIGTNRTVYQICCKDVCTEFSFYCFLTVASL